MDITNDWIKAKNRRGFVIEKRSYTINGAVYNVDGKHVILHPTKQERKIADLLCEKYGKIVEFVPQIMYPQGIQTPDYLIDGERFDLKTPSVRGKNLLYSMVYKKSRQSPNFLFDITNCPLDMAEIERQVKGLYKSQHTRFIEKVVLIKNEDVLKVYCKK